MSVQRAAVRQGIQIEQISIAWLVVEAGVALWAGLQAHSIALIAFGADSIIELFAGFVLLWRRSVFIGGLHSGVGGARPVEAQRSIRESARIGAFISFWIIDAVSRICEKAHRRRDRQSGFTGRRRLQYRLCVYGLDGIGGSIAYGVVWMVVGGFGGRSGACVLRDQRRAGSDP